MFLLRDLGPNKPFWTNMDQETKTTFFNFSLAVAWPAMDHYQRNRLTNPMLIITFLQFQHKGHWKPCSKLVGFEPGTFCFQL